MKTIFFNYPVGTPKISVTVSDKSVDILKEQGIIEKDAKCVKYPVIDENSSRELRALVEMPNYLQFDDEKNPKKVVWDMELVEVYLLEQFRQARPSVLSTLDSLQIRAMANGKDEVVKKIEKDKDRLRELPDNFSVSTAKTYQEAVDMFPNLFEDYQEKYRNDLK